MEICSRSTLVRVYREEVANDGSWETVAAKTGLSVNTARQNMSKIRSESVNVLMAAGKTEDEAKEMVKSKMPHFKQGPRGGVSKAAVETADIVADLFGDELAEAEQANELADELVEA